MTLSLLLIFIFVCSLFPSIFLPSNKIKTYILSAIAGFIIIFFLYFLCLNFPSLEYSLGKFSHPMFAFLLDGYIELSLVERYHISACLFMLFIFFLSYIISYTFVKIFYIGSNPNIHKATNVISRTLLSVLFLSLSAFLLSVFLIEIRLIIPLQDGLFSKMFQFIYKIEA